MGYRWDQPAYSLSYANRRRLEIARATATNPRLLLLDEPAAGMNPKETQEITELIAQAAHRGRLHDPRDRARHARRRGDLGSRRSRSTTASRSPRARSSRSRPRRGSSRRTSARAGWRGSERAAGTAAPARGDQHLLRADPHPPGREHRRRARASSSACSAATRPGKSTTLKTILGIVRPRTGTVRARRRGRDADADRAPDQARARDRAREPAAVRADDGAREPRDGRLPAAEGRPEGGVRARLRRCSRCSTSAARSSPARCRAASSRWSRWAAR